MRRALIAAVLTLTGCDAQWGDYGAIIGPAQSDSFAVAPADLPSFFDCLRENSATIVSAHRGEPLADASGKPLACFGEVGLTGGLPSVRHADRRLAEAAKFGLTAVLGPAEREPLRGLSAQATIRAALGSAFGRKAAARAA